MNNLLIIYWTVSGLLLSTYTLKRDRELSVFEAFYCMVVGGIMVPLAISFILVGYMNKHMVIRLEKK